MLERVRDLAEWLSPFHARFGMVRGTRVGGAVRQLEYAGQKGALVAIPLAGEPPILGRAGTHDGAVFRQIYLWRELDAPFPFAPQTIIDAGANIGVATRYLSRRFPGAQVISLEIDPDNLALLERNTTHLSRVSVRQQALWGHRARVSIENPDAATDGYRAVERADGPIDAIGVEELLDEAGIRTLDLLKMDIEGAEFEVLSMAPERWLKRVRMIMVELHERYRSGCAAALDRVIRAGHYRVTRSGEYHLLSRP
jgi:FkbM family methyltransferase